MPDADHNATLNDLFIAAYRSLLQYAVECWPWTDPDDEQEHPAVDEMAARQRAVVARIAALLDARQFPLDYGTYPNWSDLHFVSLDYLLGKVIADEESLIAAVEAAQPRLKGDGQGSAFAAELLHDERQRLERLRHLAASRNAPAAA